jgi:hypothetical protein
MADTTLDMEMFMIFRMIADSKFEGNQEELKQTKSMCYDILNRWKVILKKEQSKGKGNRNCEFECDICKNFTVFKDSCAFCRVHGLPKKEEGENGLKFCNNCLQYTYHMLNLCCTCDRYSNAQENN